MKSCSQPGKIVYLSHHPHTDRKYEYTWEIIDMGTSLVGVNTSRTNNIVREALENRFIEKFYFYDKINSEVKVNKNTRLDFVLQGPGLSAFYLEVKNCTLVRNQEASFPDAVSIRGQKHLRTLCELKEAGFGAGILYLVQRMDAKRFRPAEDIDPEYGALLRRAYRKEICIMAYGAEISLKEIVIKNSLPVILP